MAVYDLLLCGGELASEQAVARADIAISDGKIAGVGDFSKADAAETIDATGLTILPGAIDSQVHFREPGMTHKEDLETGSLAAVMGGITAVFEMPNTSPPTTNAAAIEQKLSLAAGRMHCDYAFYVGAAPDNLAHIPQLERLAGVSGVKAFLGSSTGPLLLAGEAALDELLSQLTRRAAFHSEDEARLVARMGERVAGEVASHARWRDATSALASTERLLRLAQKHKKKIHVLHVSTGEEIALLAKHKDFASVEVTPQHLTLAAPEAYQKWGTLAQMNPPIRDEAHRAALWQGVQNGTVDIIGSDHAPHTLAEKAAAYPDSPSGMPGVQTLLPLMLTHVAAGRLSLERLVALTSGNIARLFGLKNKGFVAEGFSADLTLVDRKAQYIIEESWLRSRCGWSPFVGERCTGAICGTIIKGKRVTWENELLLEHQGKPLEFVL